MRPIKLIMSAFLSYGGEETIEFSKFGNNGLYLISGETGAGKTTIFDAIMFALYGDASGDLREGTMFRSKYAEPGTDTYAELLFECNGKKYRVKRSPKYERPKKRGDGFVTQNPSAELEYFDGRPIITQVENVTKAVVEILGVTREQFSQTAMIPQGQFRDLILAETKDRQAIFRHIFETGNYNRLQEIVSQDCKALMSDKKDIQLCIDQYVDGIATEESDELEFPQGFSGDPDMLSEKILVPLKGLLDQDEKKNAESEEKLKKLNDQKTAAAGNVEKARKYEQDVKAKTEKEAQASETGQKLANAATELAEAKTAEPRIGELKGQIAVENNRLGEYDSLENLLMDRKKAESDQKKKTALKAAATEEKDKLTKALTEAEKELSTLSTVDHDLSEARAELDKTAEKAEKCENIVGRYKVLEKKQKETDKAWTEAEKKNNEARVFANNAADLRARFLHEQAGILAKDLTEGEKCPVCGSVHHPEPAMLSEEAVTEDDVKTASEASETANKEASEASSNFSSLKADRDSYEKETGEQARELVSGDDLLALVKTLQTELQEKREAQDTLIKELTVKASKKAELEKKIPEIREKRDGKVLEISELTAELSGLSEKLGSLIGQIEELQKKLPFPSRTDAEKNIRTLQEEESRLQKRIDRAQKDHDALKADVDRLAGEISQLQNSIESSEKLDLSEQQKLFDALEKEIAAVTVLGKALNTKLTKNREIYQNIGEKREELSELYKKLVWLKALDDTVSGRNIDNNGKLMLETYIQQAYFDRIVAKANRRFEQISQGHYSMARMSESMDHKGQSGLDLEVIDHYNGSRRTVKSLSGGEQFEASLSLALGLSDMVQEMSAGVKLDCMFIDEGFGSLDQETLTRAMRALKELSEGNRLVGIISHVNELNGEIDDKIEVTKDGRGFSHARITLG